MINLPKIALGAWAWGNDGTFGNDYTAESLKPIFDAAMANGLNLWDTAYAYGMGASEKVRRGSSRTCRGNPISFPISLRPSAPMASPPRWRT